MNITSAQLLREQMDTHTGTRIREQRLRAGLKQADLARSVRISPAYLNLIEHNKRRIGGKLLLDLARELNVEAAVLTQGADAVLMEGVQEAAAGAAHMQTHAKSDTLRDFVRQFPDWAGLLVEQRERISELDQRIVALNDRLVHDPFLSEALHEVLSTVTAIRSTAGILNAGDEIDPEWQARFHRNMYEDSQRLADGAQDLVGYLDTVGKSDEVQNAPLDELEAWVAHRPKQAAPTYDAIRDPKLSSPAAKRLAQVWQDRARLDEHIMPTLLVEKLWAEFGPDPTVLMRESGASFSAALRRLGTMPAQEDRAMLGLLTCDISGALTFRKSLDGFAPPRVGGACPLLPLYQSLLNPHVPLRRIITQKGVAARSYVSFAIAEPTQPVGFDKPAIMEATMMFVALDTVSAHMPTLFPDFALLEPEMLSKDKTLGDEVGTSCRVCVRQQCPARREPSLMGNHADAAQIGT